MLLADLILQGVFFPDFGARTPLELEECLLNNVLEINSSANRAV